MPETWPATLPDAPQHSTYRETAEGTTRRFVPDVGPAITRRQFTAPKRFLDMTFLMTEVQTETLDTFYQTTINRGELTFTHDHPRTGSSTTFKFIRAPQYTELGGGNFIVRVLWEVVP